MWYDIVKIRKGVVVYVVCVVVVAVCIAWS